MAAEKHAAEPDTASPDGAAAPGDSSAGRQELSDRAWRIGRVGGVDLKIHYSWLFIAFLIGWVFWARVDFLYEVSGGAEVALAVGGAAAFFASVLGHELAHALLARSRGIPVEGITLFLFGGATEARAESKTARDELVIAVVGPLTSLAIAAVLGVVANLGDTTDALFGTIGYLAWINVALAVFNLLPGLPLDGGRVFRSIAWWITGDQDRATRWAATGGRTGGYALIGLGLLSILGGGIGGLWLAAIGWLLTQAARSSESQQRMHSVFAGVTAAEVGSHPARTVPADLSVQRVVDEHFMRLDHTSFPVTRDGDVVGLVTLPAVRGVAPAQRSSVSVGDAALPLEDVLVVDAEEPMEEIVDRMERDSASGRALVRHDDGSVGIISPRDVRHYVYRADELGGAPRA